MHEFVEVWFKDGTKLDGHEVYLAYCYLNDGNEESLIPWEVCAVDSSRKIEQDHASFQDTCSIQQFNNGHLCPKKYELRTEDDINVKTEIRRRKKIQIPLSPTFPILRTILSGESGYSRYSCLKEALEYCHECKENSDILANPERFLKIRTIPPHPLMPYFQ